MLVEQPFLSASFVFPRLRDAEEHMGELAKELEAVVNEGPQGIARFAASLPPEWIDEALALAKPASTRKRKFQGQHVLWLVVGIALYEDRSMAEVVDHLELVVPGIQSISASAVTQGRQRVGPEPIRWLFLRTSQEWAGSSNEKRWRGLSLYGVDGTHLRVADTLANREEFGRPGGRNGPGDSAYPQVRLVTLLNLNTRLLVDAEFGPWTDSEHDLAWELWDSVPDDSLTILDRGFVNYVSWLTLVESGKNRHLLLRMRVNQRFKTVKMLEDGSVLAEFTTSTASRAGRPLLPQIFQARVISYRNERGEPAWLMTSLIDAAQYPANELVNLYHERWEVELAFDELKTHMLDRKEALRSKLPAGVRQELWGILLAYNLVRREMYLAAEQLGVPPRRIAFLPSLHWIQFFFSTMWRTKPGRIPHHLGEVRATLNRLVLPPRRSHRRYPRAVKIKMSNYKRNRGRPPHPIGKTTQ